MLRFSDSIQWTSLCKYSIEQDYKNHRKMFNPWTLDLLVILLHRDRYKCYSFICWAYMPTNVPCIPAKQIQNQKYKYQTNRIKPFSFIVSLNCCQSWFSENAALNQSLPAPKHEMLKLNFLWYCHSLLQIHRSRKLHFCINLDFLNFSNLKLSNPKPIAGSVWFPHIWKAPKNTLNSVKLVFTYSWLTLTESCSWSRSSWIKIIISKPFIAFKAFMIKFENRLSLSLFK